MATQKTNQGWKCPYCKEVYTEHYAAEECAEECLLKDIDEPEEYFGSSEWLCDYCGKEYNKQYLAEDCEREHRERDDKFFDVFTHKESMLKLAEAAAHPDQITLFVTITKPVLHSQE